MYANNHVREITFARCLFCARRRPGSCRRNFGSGFFRFLFSPQRKYVHSAQAVLAVRSIVRAHFRNVSSLPWKRIPAKLKNNLQSNHFTAENGHFAMRNEVVRLRFYQPLNSPHFFGLFNRINGMTLLTRLSFNLISRNRLISLSFLLRAELVK